jgi:hypothetical protein
MRQLVHSLSSEEIKLIISAVLIIIHFVLVRLKVYEKVLFFLAGHSALVGSFLQFLVSILAEIKNEELKKILRDIGIQVYILVEQWAKKNEKKGDEKFEKFLEIMKGIGVDVEKNIKEITKFVEIVNFVQNNESGDFFEKAKKVVNEIFSTSLTTKISRGFVKIIGVIFGILK